MAMGIDAKRNMLQTLVNETLGVGARVEHEFLGHAFVVMYQGRELIRFNENSVEKAYEAELIQSLRSAN